MGRTIKRDKRYDEEDDFFEYEDHVREQRKIDHDSRKLRKRDIDDVIVDEDHSKERNRKNV